MKETVELLNILSRSNSEIGLRINDIIHEYNISEKTIRQAKSRGLVAYFIPQQATYTNFYREYFYCLITSTGHDYLITGGAEGLMNRDKDNKLLSEKTLLVSKKTFIVSCISLGVAVLALLATIVVYFLSK